MKVQEDYASIPWKHGEKERQEDYYTTVVYN